jgi:hypothetical protein
VAGATAFSHPIWKIAGDDLSTKFQLQRSGFGKHLLPCPYTIFCLSSVGMHCSGHLYCIVWRGRISNHLQESIPNMIFWWFCWSMRYITSHLVLLSIVLKEDVCFFVSLFFCFFLATSKICNGRELSCEEDQFLVCQ